MKPLNILIFTLLGRGHLYPLLPLCHELSKRGHHVTCATNSDYVSDIAHSGARVLVFESSPAGVEFEKWWSSLATLPFDSPSWSSPPEEWIGRLRADTASLYGEVGRLFEAKLPDVVLYDQYFYPGFVVSRKLGCPRVRLSAHFAKYKNFLARRNGICLNPEPALAMASRVSRFISNEGIETNGRIWPLEDLNIHFIPDAFQYHRESFDESFCFAGHSMNGRFSTNWMSKGSGSPLVLVSGLSGVAGMRAASSYFRLFVDALADSECQCVLLYEGNASELGSLPPNFEAYSRASPLEFLPHAALLVCHGGMGSTLEAIYSGVPVLTIPAHPSADEVAYRVTELGLGCRMQREEVTPESLRETLGAMLWDRRLQERVKHMQDIFLRSAGIVDASDRIERFMERL